MRGLKYFVTAFLSSDKWELRQRYARLRKDHCQCYLVGLRCAGPAKRRIPFLGAAILLVCIRPVGSQVLPCTTRRLPVSFRDAQNLPLLDVSISDLEARVHGKPVRIVSLEPDPRPHRLVLVLDISGSMGSSEDERALWNLELSLARYFFDANRQRSQIALLFFNDQVNDVIDFSQGNSAVGVKLNQVAEDQKYVKTDVVTK